MIEKEIDRAIGKMIRSRRHELQQTQEQLAEQCFVRFQQIQKYETGANRVSVSKLVKIAKAQGVSVAWYFTCLSDDTQAPVAVDPGVIKLAARIRDLPPRAVDGIRQICAAIEQQGATA